MSIAIGSIWWVDQNNYSLTVAWWRIQNQPPKRRVCQERLILWAASKVISLIMNQQSPRIFRESCEFPQSLRRFVGTYFCRQFLVQPEDRSLLCLLCWIILLSWVSFLCPRYGKTITIISFRTPPIVLYSRTPLIRINWEGEQNG